MSVRDSFRRPLRRLFVAARRRVLRWAQRRQGSDGLVARLESRRIYILPSGAGIVFATVLFAMLLGAMNYNNNMGFALTFLLAGIGLAAMHQTHRNLTGVAVRFRSAEPVFAGQQLRYKFSIAAPAHDARWDLQLAWLDRNGHALDIPAGETQQVELGLVAERRGETRAPPIRVRSSFPYGLFRAWAWIDMEATGIVYPHPADRAVSSDAPGDPVSGTGRANPLGTEGFAGLREYRHGDSTRRIAWKAYAKSDELLVSEPEDGIDPVLWVDWNQFPGEPTEDRLSLLARLVIDADRTQRRYALRLPSGTIAPATGAVHLRECLTALALYNQPAAPGA